MADRKKQVVPNIETSSRFSIFETEETASSDEDAGVSGKKANNDAKNKNRNAKKRARKKKKAAANHADTNDLRNMAFGFATSGAKLSHPSITEKEKQAQHEHVHFGKDGRDEKAPPGLTKDDLRSWNEKDEQFVLNEFQRDLKEAMRKSLVEEEERRQLMLQSTQARKQKKDNSVKLSLDEFQNRPKETTLNRHHGNGITNETAAFDDWVTEAQPAKVETKPEKEKKKKKKVADKNSHKIDEDIKNDTKKSVEVLNTNGAHAASVAQWKFDLDSKANENQELKSTIEQLKEELAEVKKRNKQLCFILGQGEMRDKSDILLQVDQLTNVKDELSAELSDMHSALEQERSKVSTLKLEIAKYQSGSGRSKKHSSCEPES
eukprot:gene9697-10688_t